MTTTTTPPIYTIDSTNLVHLVWMEDEIVHDATRPFCNQPDCPCHEDADLVREYITRPLDNGLITDAEAIRIYWAGNVVVSTLATDIAPVEDEEIEAVMSGQNIWNGYEQEMAWEAADEQYRRETDSRDFDPEDDEEEDGRYRRHWLSEHL